MHCRSIVSTLVLCCLINPLTAQAQLSVSAGLIQTLNRATVGSAAIKGTDSGYDPLNDAYLVVGTCYGGPCPYGEVYGVFTSSGVALTVPFAIAPGASGHFPRVRYAAELNNGQGGFLVTWLREIGGGGNAVQARVVAWPGVPLGSVATLNDGTSYAWLESAAAVGYSQTSQRFLVAWRTYPSVSSPAHVASRLVDISGNPVESVVRLSAGFGRDPGVTWNSTANLFGVSFGAENSAGSAGFSAFAVVPPVNAATFARNSFNAISGFTYISDVDFNPDSGNFVMIWHQYTPGVPFEVRVAELNTAAQVLTEGMVSRELPGYDAHSIGFNPISRTFSVASINVDDDIVAAELNGRGVRTSAVTLLGPGVTGRYPRIATSTERPQWNISFSNAFQSIVTLGIGTSSTNGGPAGTNGSTTTTATTTPTSTATSSCTSPQPGPDWTCSNGNWLPPTSSDTTTSTSTTSTSAGTQTTATSTSTCTTAQPGSDWVCYNGGWLPPGMAPATSTSTQTSTTTTTTTTTTTVTADPSTCTTVQPGADWQCYNGGWLPPGMAPPSSTTTTTTTPTTTTPSTPASTSCPGTDPFVGIPGLKGVCVNGNWIPVSGG